MKAAQIDNYGGAGSVFVKEVDQPSPGPGQVLVEVHAAGINPFDYKVRDGAVRQMAELSFPATLGGDLAGVVAALGEGVDGLTVGQAVFGQANALGSYGSFAEFSPVMATSLATKPESVDFVAAAALPLAAVSAYQSLVDHANLRAGQKVLIHGGAGGIGSLAIQIAKSLGVFVATTVSSGDVDFAKSLGADEVIDYGSTDFSTQLKDYDLVFDTVGGETYQKSFTVLKAGGHLVSMTTPVDEALAKEHQVIAITQRTQVSSQRLNQVRDLVDKGQLKVNVDKVFPLAEADEALEYKTGHPRGKVVLQVK